MLKIGICKERSEKMRKVIFSDYDGTLYTDLESVPKNIEKIKEFRAKGNLFCIATGRSYKDLRVALDRYDIPADYFIMNHGGVIMNSREEVIEFNLIDRGVGDEIAKMLKNDAKVIKVIMFDILKNRIDDGKNELTKMLIEIDGEKSARELAIKINERWKNEVKAFVVDVKSGFIIEIVSAQTDKGMAIETILKRENIDSNDVYVIGDGETDTMMMKNYHGFGMAKSDEAVYKVAKKIYNSVAELICDILEENF